MMPVVEKECLLFVHDAHVSFRQTPLTRLSKREDVAYVKLLRNIKAEFVSHHFPCVFMYRYFIRNLGCFHYLFHN